jgi:hypothetical protein
MGKMRILKAFGLLAINNFGEMAMEKSVFNI